MLQLHGERNVTQMILFHLAHQHFFRSITLQKILQLQVLWLVYPANDKHKLTMHNNSNAENNCFHPSLYQLLFDRQQQVDYGTFLSWPVPQKNTLLERRWRACLQYPVEAVAYLVSLIRIVQQKPDSVSQACIRLQSPPKTKWGEGQCASHCSILLSYRISLGLSSIVINVPLRYCEHRLPIMHFSVIQLSNKIILQSPAQYSFMKLSCWNR